MSIEIICTQKSRIQCFGATLSHDLSARLQSVTSARQLSCIILTWLQHVSSAQLHCVSSAAMCQLSCNVPAQVHFVSSAAICLLSCRLSCHLSTQLSAQLQIVSFNRSARLYSMGSAAVCHLSCVLSAWLWFVASAAVSCILQGEIGFALFSWQIQIAVLKITSPKEVCQSDVKLAGFNFVIFNGMPESLSH